MDDRKRNPFLKIELNSPEALLFKFDTGFENKTTYNGKEITSFLYTVEKNDSEYTLSATASLNTLLQQHAPLKDKTLTIAKVKKDDKITIFTVNGVSIDDLKKGKREEYTSVFDPKPLVIDEHGKTNLSVDDLWRKINNIEKELRVVKVQLEKVEEKKEEKPEFPF